ncbi:MAG TPA: hypothetical protein VHS53_05775 [Mucilaginibacter sp.]|nr:hypothetical protein [Mucilaginibacter sp.]
MNKNYILWGLMGLGIMVAPLLLVVLAMVIFSNKFFIVGFWPIAILASLVLSVGIAAVIAFKNNSVFKKQS